MIQNGRSGYNSGLIFFTKEQYKQYVPGTSYPDLGYIARYLSEITFSRKIYTKHFKH